GFWSARSVGESVELLEDGNVFETFHFLRQQEKPFRSLADYVAPAESSLQDYMGAFVVTAGAGVEKWAEELKAKGDDYGSIMVKALGDRIAEALAEMMHKRVREFWGYGREETLTYDDLIRERYRGIRPAPGYPACPEHTEKRKIFALLNATTATGASLTENCAMAPASTVCGYYFSHPESKYFSVQRIGADQMADYAARKGWSKEEARRWLSPLL